MIEGIKNLKYYKRCFRKASKLKYIYIEKKLLTKKKASRKLHSFWEFKLGVCS